jgi:hypothetical protein
MSYVHVISTVGYNTFNIDQQSWTGHADPQLADGITVLNIRNMVLRVIKRVIITRVLAWCMKYVMWLVLPWRG